MSTNNNNIVTGIISIVVIGILTVAALQKGLDGQLFALCIIAIAGLGGYEVYKAKKEEVKS